jgi:hypothetical protein
LAKKEERSLGGRSGKYKPQNPKTLNRRREPKISLCSSCFRSAEKMGSDGGQPGPLALCPMLQVSKI